MARPLAHHAVIPSNIAIISPASPSSMGMSGIPTLPPHKSSTKLPSPSPQHRQHSADAYQRTPSSPAIQPLVQQPYSRQPQQRMNNGVDKPSTAQSPFIQAQLSQYVHQQPSPLINALPVSQAVSLANQIDASPAPSPSPPPSLHHPYFNHNMHNGHVPPPLDVDLDGIITPINLSFLNGLTSFNLNVTANQQMNSNNEPQVPKSANPDVLSMSGQDWASLLSRYRHTPDESGRHIQPIRTLKSKQLDATDNARLANGDSIADRQKRGSTSTSEDAAFSPRALTVTLADGIDEGSEDDESASNLLVRKTHSREKDKTKPEANANSGANNAAAEEARLKSELKHIQHLMEQTRTDQSRMIDENKLLHEKLLQLQQQQQQQIQLQILQLQQQQQQQQHQMAVISARAAVTMNTPPYTPTLQSDVFSQSITFMAVPNGNGSTQLPASTSPSAAVVASEVTALPPAPSSVQQPSLTVSTAVPGPLSPGPSSQQPSKPSSAEEDLTASTGTGQMQFPPPVAASAEPASPVSPSARSGQPPLPSISSAVAPAASPLNRSRPLELEPSSPMVANDRLSDLSVLGRHVKARNRPSRSRTFDQDIKTQPRKQSSNRRKANVEQRNPITGNRSHRKDRLAAAAGLPVDNGSGYNAVNTNNIENDDDILDETVNFPADPDPSALHLAPRTPAAWPANSTNDENIHIEDETEGQHTENNNPGVLNADNNNNNDAQFSLELNSISNGTQFHTNGTNTGRTTGRSTITHAGVMSGAGYPGNDMVTNNNRQASASAAACLNKACMERQRRLEKERDKLEKAIKMTAADKNKLQATIRAIEMKHKAEIDVKDMKIKELSNKLNTANSNNNKINRLTAENSNLINDLNKIKQEYERMTQMYEKKIQQLTDADDDNNNNLSHKQPQSSGVRPQQSANVPPLPRRFSTSETNNSASPTSQILNNGNNNANVNPSNSIINSSRYKTHREKYTSSASYSHTSTSVSGNSGNGYGYGGYGFSGRENSQTDTTMRPDSPDLDDNIIHAHNNNLNDNNDNNNNETTDNNMNDDPDLMDEVVDDDNNNGNGNNSIHHRGTAHPTNTIGSTQKTERHINNSVNNTSNNNNSSYGAKGSKQKQQQQQQQHNEAMAKLAAAYGTSAISSFKGAHGSLRMKGKKRSKHNNNTNNTSGNNNNVNNNNNNVNTNGYAAVVKPAGADTNNVSPSSNQQKVNNIQQQLLSLATQAV